VRNDRQNLGDDLVDSEAWNQRNEQFARSYYVVTDEETGKPVARVHPFSAGERNRFFANVAGQYVDLTPLSGLDSKADSRSFVYLDFDRDGDHDIALANANSPSLELWRTQVAEPGNFVAVSLEGGAMPDDAKGWSNRSAVGALVTVTTPSGLRLVKELHCGEGFGSQNSRTLIFGLGKDVNAESVQVVWPSGRRSEWPEPLTAGQHLHFHERGERPRSANYQP